MPPSDGVEQVRREKGMGLRKWRFGAIILTVIVALAVLLAAAGCGSGDDGGDPGTTGSSDATATQRYDGESLMVYAGAALRKPMDDIAAAFTDKYGCTIEYTYAGSAQNLSQIELAGEGDIYVPGDESYSDITLEKGLSEEAQPVVLHILAIGVPASNPASISSLEDLAKPGVKVALPDPESASSGKLAVKVLENAGILEAVQKNVVVMAATEPEIVVYLSMEQADAALIWEDNIATVDDIEIIDIDAELGNVKTIPVAVLKSTTNHELAQLFADFVASDEVLPTWEKYGYRPAE